MMENHWIYFAEEVGLIKCLKNDFRVGYDVIFIDTGKPNRKEILEQIMNCKPLISDEEAFERHLIRKWSKK